MASEKLICRCEGCTVSLYEVQCPECGQTGEGFTAPEQGATGDGVIDEALRALRLGGADPWLCNSCLSEWMMFATPIEEQEDATCPYCASVDTEKGWLSTIPASERLRAAGRRVRGEWNPIDTAPKDGTQILAWVPSYFQGRGGLALALWQDDAWWDSRAWKIQPTHWTDLPGPPTPGGDDGEE